MEAPRPHRPPSIRLVNALGRAASGLGLRLPSLSEESLLRAAEEATGLADFGPSGFRPGLHQLLASLERDAALNSIGRIFARGQIVDLLANRLRLLEHRKRHPDLANQRVERPLFVLGLPRTGTTILYGLLAQDPAHRSPLSWEVGFPCPPPRGETYHDDPRIGQMDRQLDQLRRCVDCIRCGACFSDCPKRGEGGEFIGPAACVDLFRFFFDPRDGSREKRGGTALAPGGIFDCDSHANCVKVCPKDVRPLRAITFMKREFPASREE